MPGKQEIETGELYQFGGCTALPCSTATDNGKFYLIESSRYFPTLFCPEENVFANIPQQDGSSRHRGCAKPHHSRTGRRRRPRRSASRL
jgi:hypothetical protein